MHFIGVILIQRIVGRPSLLFVSGRVLGVFRWHGFFRDSLHAWWWALSWFVAVVSSLIALW